MELAFLDRDRERQRLRRWMQDRQGTLAVVYGRRRLGKSRLIQQVVRGRRVVYCVGDERDAAIQRSALAREIASVLPGFADVAYPAWEPLLDRWWREAPPRAILALDEFPAFASASPELPSVLQKFLDRRDSPGRHVLLCGSSQRMMHGLVLEGSAPLYGRAREILKLEPLEIPWLRRAFGLRRAEDAVDRWAVWGGVPRYWELARLHPDHWTAVRELALDPLGVLHREPERLLRDELETVARSASLLTLAGQGVNRISEMGARLGVPATSLSRPLALLVDLGLLRREVPFGRTERDTKRTLYRIADPFLRFWYRFVEPNRSRLGAGALREVEKEVDRAWPEHLGTIWEDLARSSVPRIAIHGRRWGAAARWWGPGSDGRPLEIDVVAASVDDPGTVLIGEAVLSAGRLDSRRAFSELASKAARCPALAGQSVLPALWILHPRGRLRGPSILTAPDVVGVASGAGGDLP